MRIARIETTYGARHAIWTGDAWAVVEDGFADPPIRTGVTVEADDARLLAPCEPQVLVGIAHNKTNNNHPSRKASSTSLRGSLSVQGM